MAHRQARGRPAAEAADLVALLYDAAAGSSGWDEAMCLFNRRFGLHNVAVSICEEDGALSPGLHSAPPAQINDYVEHWSGSDPLLHRFLARARQRPHVLYSERELFSQAEWARPNIGEIYFQQAGLGGFLGFGAPEGDRLHCFVTLLEEGRDLPEAERADLQRFGSHFMRAARLYWSRQSSEAALEVLLGLQGEAGRDIVLLDAEGRIGEASPGALAALGAAASLTRGRLRLQGAPAFGEAAATPRLLALPREAGGLPVLVEIRRAEGSGTGSAPPGWVLIVTDPAARLDCAKAPLRALGLTAAEARLAVLAGACQTSTEVAAALGLSPATVRWSLSVIYGKLGLKRQTQLARLTARLSRPAPAALH
ncbi:helix-turn-helix transcriptional regulator [Pseudoroseicyclus sp. H15]